jgi:hypothetical protein
MDCKNSFSLKVWNIVWKFKEAEENGEGKDEAGWSSWSRASVTPGGGVEGRDEESMESISESNIEKRKAARRKGSHEAIALY